VKNSRAKPRQLTALPDITGLVPLLHDFSLERLETSTNLHIDLSNVKKVDSIGLSIYLALHLLGKRDPQDYVVSLSWSNFERVNSTLRELDIVNLLETFRFNVTRHGPTVELFDNPSKPSCAQIPAAASTPCADEFQEIVPFCPKSHANRQEALNSFSRSLKKFMARDSPRMFNREQIISVLLELAKNTFDHSSGVGVAGLRTVLGPDKVKKMQFVYCDSGQGISRNVRDYLDKQSGSLLNSKSEIKRLSKKGSAIDLLHKAFGAGFTTKPGNGVNFGMGLTVVSQGAAGCGFDVLVRDADSIIDLSGMKEPFSHAGMRAKAARTTATRLLMFLIERELESDRANPV
jgi:ABC-type transporter Mla MlaB component